MTKSTHPRAGVTGSAYLEKAPVLMSDRHLELARTAAKAYRRLLEIRAAGPEWDRAHQAWTDAAESLAIAVLKHVEQQEGRQ